MFLENQQIMFHWMTAVLISCSAIIIALYSYSKCRVVWFYNVCITIVSWLRMHVDIELDWPENCYGSLSSALLVPNCFRLVTMARRQMTSTPTGILESFTNHQNLACFFSKCTLKLSTRNWSLPLFAEIKFHNNSGEEFVSPSFDITFTNPIFPTASLWWLSTWHTKALQRCTAILWMDSSCRAGSRIFSSSWLTRLYWNSSSSGILKLHRVKQQFLWTWSKQGQGHSQLYNSKL